MVCLQEELIGVKLREAEALSGLKELRQQVRDLEEHWQVNTQSQRQLFYPQFENKCVCKLYCVAVLPCAVPFMLPILTHKCLSKVLWCCVQRHLARTAGAGKTVRGRMQRVSFRMSWWAWGSEKQRHRLSSENQTEDAGTGDPGLIYIRLLIFVVHSVECSWEGQFLSLFKGCPRLRIYVVKSELFRLRIYIVKSDYLADSQLIVESYVWGRVRQIHYQELSSQTSDSHKYWC